MFPQPSVVSTRKIPALERNIIREEASDNLRNEAVLRNIRKTLESDRKYITRHPVLKHLFLRYEAILNDHTVFGHPRARVEPSDEFSNRVNELTVDIANKEAIKRKKHKAKNLKTSKANTTKAKGKSYYERTNTKK